MVISATIQEFSNVICKYFSVFGRFDKYEKESQNLFCPIICLLSIFVINSLCVNPKNTLEHMNIYYSTQYTSLESRFHCFALLETHKTVSNNANQSHLVLKG